MTNDDLVMVKDVLFNTDTLPTCLYGTFSRVGFDISMEGKLQVHIAEVLEGATKGKAQKGVQKYDNDNRVNFTLSPNECHHILNNIKEVINGTYVDRDPRSDPKYQNVFKIVHYPAEGEVSRLTLQRDKETESIKISISNPGSKNLSFVLVYDKDKARYDRSLFLSFVENVAKNGLYNAQVFKSQIKIMRQMLDKYIKGGDGNGSSSSGGYQKNAYNKQQAPKRFEQPVNRTPEPVAVSSGSYDEPEEDDDIPF